MKNKFFMILTLLLVFFAAQSLSGAHFHEDLEQIPHECELCASFANLVADVQPTTLILPFLGVAPPPHQARHFTIQKRSYFSFYQRAPPANLS